MHGLTWNEFGGYYEGDAWAARGDEIERRELQEEREHAAMERMAKLYAAMAQEFADEGKTRRWHSLMNRAEDVRTWWHVSPNASSSAEGLKHLNQRGGTLRRAAK